MKPMMLIAGATGYVGGELLKALLNASYSVRCLARRPEALKAAALPGIEVVAVIRQTASFDPLGLFGRAYWYSVLPFHHFVFNGMIQGIAASLGDSPAAK